MTSGCDGEDVMPARSTWDVFMEIIEISDENGEFGGDMKESEERWRGSGRGRICKDEGVAWSWNENHLPERAA